MATYYVDGTKADDTGDGLSEANAKKTVAAGIALMTTAGDKLYIKISATYLQTTTINVTVPGAANTGFFDVEGYLTTPGDEGAGSYVDMTCATNSIAFWSLNDAEFWRFKGLKLTHSAATRGHGFNGVTNATSQMWIENCIIDSCLIGLAGLITPNVINTEIKNSVLDAATCTNVRYYGCDIHDNGGDGYDSVGGSTATVWALNTIFDSNGGKGINQDSTNSTVQMILDHCIFVDNVSDGLFVGDPTVPIASYISNCIFAYNGNPSAGYGQNHAEAAPEVNARMFLNRNNAYLSNTSGARNNVGAGIGDVTLTVDPFVDRTNRDFRLNNTAGGGAACRAAGFPALRSGGTTTAYPDIGLQHQDSGSGGAGPVIGPGRLIR
jgi:hypothetical protein